MDPSECRAVGILGPLPTSESLVLSSIPGIQKGCYNTAKVPQGSPYPQVSWLYFSWWFYAVKSSNKLLGKAEALTLYNGDYRQQAEPPIIGVLMAFLLEFVELVYLNDFSFKLKSRTVKTKNTTRVYKTNFLLAYCQGSNNICGFKQ